IAHEAMLTHWQRLAGWVTHNRESLKIRAQVAADTAQWLENKRNADYLYPRGLPLEKARNVLAEGFLNAEEREFINASVGRAEQTSRLRVRRLKQVAAGFALLALLAIVAGTFAWKKRPDAIVARDERRATVSQSD